MGSVGGVLTLNLTPGSAAVPTFYLQGQGLATGPGSVGVTLTASISGFATGSGTITIVPSGFVINQGNFTTTTFSPATALSASICAWNSTLTSAVNCGETVGPQAGGPVSVTFSSSNTATGTITGSGQVTFTAGGSTSAGGVSFQPAGAGTSTISIAAPSGFSTLPTTSTQITATVTAPAITVNAQNVGNNLELAGSISLAAAVPSTAVSPTITLTSSDPTHLQLSTSSTVTGLGSVGGVLTLNLTPGSAAVPTFYLQGQGLATGPGSVSVTLNAKVSGFSDGNGTITILPATFEINQGNFTTSTTSSPTALSVSVCAWNSTLTSPVNCGENVGPQAGASVSVPFSSSNTAVGTITGSGQVTFTAGGSTSAGGVSFQPVGVGTSTVSIAAPSGFSTPPVSISQITVTVN